MPTATPLKQKFVTIDPEHKTTLESLTPNIKVDCPKDFLSIEPKPTIDRVLMNPPFTAGQDAEHVIHAYKFLKTNGILVAIIGEGSYTRSDKKAVAFQNFLKQHMCDNESIEAGTFKESGTNVATRMIRIVKQK